MNESNTCAVARVFSPERKNLETEEKSGGLGHSCSLPFRTNIFSSQVLQDEGEEAYFAAFEAQDGDNFRCVDEDGFVDALESFAPGGSTRSIFCRVVIHVWWVTDHA